MNGVGSKRLPISFQRVSHPRAYLRDSYPLPLVSYVTRQLTNCQFYRNLWDLAASQLSEKNKACINFSPAFKLDDLLAAVDDRKHDCQQNQWTVERGPGRNAIVLRDVLTKIATWIEKFVACGDCAVQYDPGHAALPWAAVRFLLKVVSYSQL